MGHVFDPFCEEQKKRFFRQAYGAHLPGYTGHCPTLKFRVGKRFGASTEEIMRELLDKKILKTGPYKPSETIDHEILVPISREKNITNEWTKNETKFHNAPPYILGYTGYIPGFNSSYGLPFMRAVEEGAKEWYQTQSKLRAQRDSMRAYANIPDPRGLLSRVRNDNVNSDIVRHSNRKRTTLDYQLSPENPPIVGYTGHIPGAKAETALSKRYTLAARKGMEMVRKEREGRHSKEKHALAVQNALEAANIDRGTPENVRF